MIRRILQKLTKSKDSSEGFSSDAYWERRYATGGNSGIGSYGELADYKAQFVNAFLERNEVRTVVEFGCGDGNQLSPIHYRNYVGLDVSPTAVESCRRRFAQDANRAFYVYSPGRTASFAFGVPDLVVCLDVLYHIIPEEEFKEVLKDIFGCSAPHVLLYTNLEARECATPHIKFRDTFSYLRAVPDYYVAAVENQPHPELSNASFIYLAKKEHHLIPLPANTD